MCSVQITSELDASTDESEWKVTSTLMVLADNLPVWTQLLRSEEVCELWARVCMD